MCLWPSPVTQHAAQAFEVRQQGTKHSVLVWCLRHAGLHRWMAATAGKHRMHWSCWWAIFQFLHLHNFTELCRLCQTIMDSLKKVTEAAIDTW